MSRVILMCVGFAVALTLFAKEKQPMVTGETNVFETPVDGPNAMLVILKGEDLDKSKFDFLDKQMLQQTARIYQVRAELHSPKAKPLLLASYLRFEGMTAVDPGLQVLDVLKEDSGVTLCLAEGAELRIWHIGYSNTCTFYGPSARYWSIYPARRPLTHLDFVTIKLGRVAGDGIFPGKLTLELQEKGSDTHYLFKEAREASSPTFNLAKQW